MRIFIFLVLASIAGCGEQKYDGNDPDSVTKMIATMSDEEQTAFFDDAELVSHVLGHEKKMQGYTAKNIKEQADKIRVFIKNKNITFLKETIYDMEVKGSTVATLYIDPYGLITPPKLGVIGFKKYSIDDLKGMLNGYGESNLSSIMPLNKNPKKTTESDQKIIGKDEDETISKQLITSDNTTPEEIKRKIESIVTDELKSNPNLKIIKTDENGIIYFSDGTSIDPSDFEE